MNRIVLVCGAPGSGKSSYVTSRFRRGQDLICDYDRIMAALCDQPEHHSPRQFHFVAVAAVEGIYARLTQQRDCIDTAWVIACLPGEKARKEMAKRLGAQEIVLVTTPEEVCIRRVTERAARADGVAGVSQWFNAEITEQRAAARAAWWAELGGSSLDPSRILAQSRISVPVITVVNGADECPKN